MAMELPVIVTNWSGMTEYMTDFNSYPLPLDGMTEVLDGPFKGHLWAEPSLAHLQVLMRKVFSNPREAKRRGKVARKDMVTKFSPEVVTRNILKQLMRLQKEIQLRERRDDPAL
jgi:glycosyltransferase involved in cell wall biosynthesis